MSGDLQFEPGARYRYCNTGYYLLAVILERVTGLSYEENLRQRILKPVNLKDTGVDSYDRLLPKRAMGYVKVPGGYANAPYEYPPNLLGTGNLYSTVEDLLAWNRALRSGKLLPRLWQDRMLTVYASETREEHAYSVNYFTRRGAAGREIRYCGFSGGMPGFMTDAFWFPDDELMVVLFDNSSQYNHWRIAPGVRAILAGEPCEQPNRLASDTLARVAVDEGVQAAVERHRELREAAPFGYEFRSLEADLNTLGYQALDAGYADSALAVLELNTLLFPQSWNTYDSLGEAHLRTGQHELSRRNYAKAHDIRHREDRVLSLIRAGQFDEAERAIKDVHTRERHAQVFTPAKIGPLFEEYLRAGRYDEALRLCKVWAAGNPKTVGPEMSMARVYRATSDVKNAIACYERALAIAPRGPSSDRIRGLLAEVDGKDDTGHPTP
jgi:Tfp pilus assembly protein PilF